MKTIDIEKNLIQIIKKLEERGIKPTNIAKSMGYTTTAQLNSILNGKSLVSTKAIINMIENLGVNPSYLFLGEGSMFLTDKDELEELRNENARITRLHGELADAFIKLAEINKKLEKRNADLIDLTSAAIKYHKGQQEVVPDMIPEDKTPDFKEYKIKEQNLFDFSDISDFVNRELKKIIEKREEKSSSLKTPKE